jgi:spore maturation protein CgeB
MARRMLYVAPLGPGYTTLYRYHALQRLKQNLIPFDVRHYDYKIGKLNAMVYHLPIGPLVVPINLALVAAVQKERPEIVWLDRPMVFTPHTIRRIKQLGAFTVCFNQDNAFCNRYGGPLPWYQFRRVFRLMDLHCLFREADVRRYREWGLNYVVNQFSYEPTEHFPPPQGWSDADRTREVSFIGSPYDDRPQFLRNLIEVHKLPVVISGGRWSTAFNKEELARYTRGESLVGPAYRENIWKSKINLAFVTQNEDDVSHKSFEIAACGAFLLALRTPGHQACFEEGKEAEFFSSVEECAEKCRYYLDHPAERQAIAARGRERAVRSGYDNDTQLTRILARLDEMHSATPPNPS